MNESKRSNGSGESDKVEREGARDGGESTQTCHACLRVWGERMIAWREKPLTKEREKDSTYVHVKLNHSQHKSFERLNTKLRRGLDA